MIERKGQGARWPAVSREGLGRSRYKGWRPLPPTQHRTFAPQRPCSRTNKNRSPRGFKLTSVFLRGAHSGQHPQLHLADTDADDAGDAGCWGCCPCRRRDGKCGWNLWRKFMENGWRIHGKWTDGMNWKKGGQKGCKIDGTCVETGN